MDERDRPEFDESEIVWTLDWPTEPGDYWFYGWSFGCFGEKPKMHLAECRKISSGVIYIINGHFMWRNRGHVGRWTPTVFPEAPYVDDLLENGK